MFPSWRGFPPGALASSHSPKAYVRLIDESKLPVGVSESVYGLCVDCDVTCPGCTLPFAQ